MPLLSKRSLLTLISLIVLLHSMSIYAVTAVDDDGKLQVEQAQDTDSQEPQLQAYDALIPTFQGMAPLVLYFIHEVVLISEPEYLVVQAPDYHENHCREVLFPRIISPNAP